MASATLANVKAVTVLEEPDARRTVSGLAIVATLGEVDDVGPPIHIVGRVDIEGDIVLGVGCEGGGEALGAGQHGRRGAHQGLGSKALGCGDTSSKLSRRENELLLVGIG